jgi:site-specific DNA recombinase
VSTEDQAEHGVSMGEMRRQIHERIEERRWGLFGIFEDVLSGSRSDRRGLQAMLAARKEFDVLVVWSIDRLGREFVDQIVVVGKLREAGVGLEVLNGPVDLDTPEGKAQFGLRAVFAEYERDTIIGRARMTAKAIAREGRYNGPPPTGYGFVDHHLVASPAEVVVVNRVFAEFLAGTGVSQICRNLNADRVPTRRGAKWRPATLTAMLGNPVYIGKIRVDGEICEGLHEGILAPEDFEAAQTLLKAQGTPRGKGRGRKPKGPHLFIRGLLKCGTCGDSMIPRSPTYGAEAYLCNGRQSADCQMPIAYRADIDGAVYAYFEQVGLDLEATRQTVAEQRDRKLVEIRELLSEAEQEQRRAEVRLERVRRDYIDGELDAAEWKSFRDDLDAGLAAAGAEVDRLQEQERAVAEWAEFTDAEQTVLEQLTRLRQVVAGKVRDADAVDPVRAALASAFERFVLHHADSPDAPLALHTELGMVGDSGFVLDPIVREKAIAGYSESMQPVLHRQPLQQAENNERQGFGYRLIDG